MNSYFSYEHFYVLYCKFWELDTDHDFLLSQDDLVRYGGHSLTRVIVDRIFEHGRRPFARVQSLSVEDKKKMSYEDFICTSCLSCLTESHSYERLTVTVTPRLYAVGRGQEQRSEHSLLV